MTRKAPARTRLIATATLSVGLVWAAATNASDANEAPADARVRTPAPVAEDANRDPATIGRVRLGDGHRSTNGILCRRERPLGSRIPVRVCRSEQQMALERDDGKRRVRATQRHQSRVTSR